MKHFLTVLLLFLSVNPLSSQTLICDEVWSGTIVMDSDIVVGGGCTLTVEPGTIVNGEQYTLTVEGQLQAVGTLSQNITINIASLLSRTDADLFRLEYAVVSEHLIIGSYSNINEYQPILMPFMNETGSSSNWNEHFVSNGIPLSSFGPVEGVGHVYQDFESSSGYSPWSSGWYYWGTYYQDNSPVALEVENGNTFIQQTGSICTTASSVANDLTASFEVNPSSSGEFITEIEFDYRMHGGSNDSFSVLVKEGGCSTSGYQNIGGTSTRDEWTHFNLKVPGQWQSMCIKLRANGSPNPAGQGCANFYNRGDLDNFEIRTNYAPTSQGIPFQEAILSSVSSGGMTINNVDWIGDISAACDSCNYQINNTSFTPTVPTAAAVIIQGEDNEVYLTDCTIQNGFQAGIHLEDCVSSTVNLMRSSILHSSVHGVYCGEGWSGEVQNVAISNQNAPGFVSNTNKTLVLNHCTIADNEGLGIDISGTGLIDIKNSIIWNNNLGNLSQISTEAGLIQIAYSDIQGLSDYGIEGLGTFSSLEGNIELSPQFAENDNFELETFSPCVDAGEPFNNDAYRPPGKGESRSDMGWLGGPDLLPIGTAGCTNPYACNYNPESFSDDNSCTLPEEFYDCNGECLIDSDADGICDQLESVEDQYTNGYNAGYAAGLSACLESCGAEPTSSSCGPGTYWNEYFNLCLPNETCTGDLNDDGNRALGDLLLLLSYYGTSCDE